MIYILGGLAVGMIALIIAVAMLAKQTGRDAERAKQVEAALKEERKVNDAVATVPTVHVDDDWLRNVPADPSAGQPGAGKTAS